MGRERQRKKNRSSIPKSRKKVKDRTKAGRKKVDFLGSETIAKNWDRKLTATQNYTRLGLSSRLKGPTRGSGKIKYRGNDTDVDVPRDSFAVPVSRDTGKLIPEEVQVERDPVTGHIKKVIRPTQDNHTKPNPLNDPLNEIMDVDYPNVNSTPVTDVVARLEAEAASEEIALAKSKRPRQQSQREKEWITRLVGQHGNNTQAMAKDRKLNPMQQTESDIRRRLETWQQSNN